MAKKKSGKKGKKRSSGRKGGAKRKKGGHRRRRNPGGGTFMSRAGHLAGGALVALATGILVTVATGKISPGSNVSLYGIPLATFVGGVAIAGKAPTIGTGMALGAFGPFALPAASHILAGGSPSMTPVMARTAAGLGRAARQMRAVSMGRSEPSDRNLDAVSMGAVSMGGEDDFSDNYDD